MRCGIDVLGLVALEGRCWRYPLDETMSGRVQRLSPMFRLQLSQMDCVAPLVPRLG